MHRTAKDRVPGSYAVVFKAQYASLIPYHLKAQPNQWVGRRVLIEGVNSGCAVPYAQVTDKDGNEACIDLIHLNPNCPQTFDETAPAGADVPEGATHELRGLYYKARDGVLMVYLPHRGGWQPSGNNPADMLGAVPLREAPTANPVTPGLDLHVSVTQLTHNFTTASIVGHTCKVVYYDEELGLVWVVNSDTGHVCRAAVRDLSDRSAEALRGYEFPGAAIKQPPVQASSYIVWSPEGNTPPRKKHHTLSEAKAAARVLAAWCPGQTFHVCALVGGALVEAKTTERVVVEETHELKEF